MGRREKNKGSAGADSPMLMAARAYTGRGWRVVPVRPGEKGVTLHGWQHMRLGEDDLHNWFGWFPRPSARDREELHNVGLLTGEPSGGLVDVDCDSDEARRAAADLLPATGMISGRAGSPASHYWYRVVGELPATTKYAEGASPDPSPYPPPLRGERGPEPEALQPSPPGSMVAQALPAPGRVAEGREGSSPAALDHHRSMLVELRATGCQTVAPPSIHPSGEVIRWERGDPGRGEDCEPGIVTGAALRHAVGQVAAAALLARRWPGAGQRDEAAKDLAGLLLRGGWGAPETDRFIRLVARIAGDEEWRQRGKATRTAEKLAAGEPVTGGPSLAERLGYHSGDGERVVARLRDWLDLSGADAARAPTLAQKSTLAHSQNMSKSDMMSKSEGGMAPRVDVVTVLARDVKRTSVRWLWPGRIPLGKITLLDGDPGLGKSLLTIDLAARVTTGSAMPDGSLGIAGGGGAVLLSSEDDPADTIVPRLEAAAADLGRVVLVQEVSETSESATGALSDGTEQGLSRQFLLPHDIPRLEQAIQQVDARLVVIDPLMAYLDSRINSWRDQDMRATLAPLAKLAERMGTAVLILRHLNKATGMSAIHRGGGSIGIIGAARAGLLVAKHPDNPEHERVLAVTKSNLGPPPPSLRYQLVAPLREVEGLDDEGIEYLRDVPVVEWLGTSEMTASTLLAASTADENPEHLSKEEEAMEWLRETLADGPHLTGEVEHAALAAGITKPTLRRARERMGVITIRQGNGSNHAARWSLPDPAAS